MHYTETRRFIDQERPGASPVIASAMESAKEVKGAGGRIGANRKKSVSKTVKASLQFPVGRVARFMRMRRGRYSKLLGTGAPIYLPSGRPRRELAGNAALDNKKQRINPRNVLLAVRNDEELGNLLQGVTIASGGVLPNISPVLLRKKPSSSSADDMPKQH